jgi:hypothetical protein
MIETCADCGSREFKCCFTESFPARGRDGTALTLTMRLCLACGARFPDRGELRSHLLQKLPTSAPTARAPELRQ